MSKSVETDNRLTVQPPERIETEHYTLKLDKELTAIRAAYHPGMVTYIIEQKQ